MGQDAHVHVPPPPLPTGLVRCGGIQNLHPSNREVSGELQQTPPGSCLKEDRCLLSRGASPGQDKTILPSLLTSVWSNQVSKAALRAVVDVAAQLQLGCRWTICGSRQHAEMNRLLWTMQVVEAGADADMALAMTSGVEAAMAVGTTATVAWAMMMAVDMVRPVLQTTAGMVDMLAMAGMEVLAMERRRLWAWSP